MSQGVPPGTQGNSQSKRILILGAGAGGLRLSLDLDRRLIGRRDYPVLLVDQHDYHQILPRLPDVAAGFASPESVLLPVRRLLGARKVDFRRATVEGLDLANQRVATSAGPLAYRWLVIALGSQASTHGLPVADANVLFLKSVADARRIHEAMGEAFRQAAWKLDQAEREAMATVVVVGAGYTGVELAAGLMDRARALAAQYRLPAGLGRVVLVERADRVLPEYSRDLAEIAQSVLRRKGVEVRLGVSVAGVADGEVALASGERLRGGTLIWAGGNELPPVLRASGLPLGRDGRIVVDREMRVPGHPGVYALGDVCAVQGEAPSPPPSAKLAIEQADVVAHNIVAELAGGAPRQFSPAAQDAVVSLGRGEAVATVRGFVLSGWRAIAAKRVAEARYLEAIGGAGGLVARLFPGREFSG